MSLPQTKQKGESILEKDSEKSEPEKSEEYKNFENLLKQVLSVSKADVDRNIKAEKDAKKKKQIPTN